MKVFDFFSGCGGTSQGFKDLGFKIIGALDFDKDSATTYKNNFPEAHFIHNDIKNVAAEELAAIIGKDNEPLLFCGCAPCQPFSKQRTVLKKIDERRNLLGEFQRFVEFWKPEYIFLENVPGLQNFNKSEGVFKDFLNSLDRMNYKYDMAVVQASDLGVPQIRKRFILIAADSNHYISPIKNIIEKYKGLDGLDTRRFIADLPPIKAGEIHPNISNHAAAMLSPINLKRIKHTPEGGDRRNWPDDLKTGCHRNYVGHTDVYGRMKWKGPAPTLTTRCISYSNGRFGHPEQDRAISVREAARLQTFSDHFIFSGSLISCAKQVGNAVPPLMAQRISECFLQD